MECAHCARADVQLYSGDALDGSDAVCSRCAVELMAHGHRHAHDEPEDCEVVLPSATDPLDSRLRVRCGQRAAVEWTALAVPGLAELRCDMRCGVEWARVEVLARFAPGVRCLASTAGTVRCLTGARGALHFMVQAKASGEWSLIKGARTIGRVVSMERA